MHYCRPPSDLWLDALALPELSGPAEVPSIRDLNVVRREVADARGALQSIWFACSTLGVATSGRPPGIGYSFRVPHPLSYRPYGLSDPTLPLAVSSAVWFFLARVSLVTVQRPDQALSSSFASL